MSKAAKHLLDDVNAVIDGKRALKTFIRDMGYSIGPRQISFSLKEAGTEKEQHFIIYELHDVDDPKRIVPFSFLYLPTDENGLILPHPYTKYQETSKNDKATS